MAIGFVADFGDTFNLSFICEFGNALDELRLVNLKWNFSNDHSVAFMAATADPIDRRLGPHLQNPTTLHIRLANLFASADKSAGRKIGSLDDLAQLFDLQLGFAYQGNRCIQNFSQIMRRNVGGHSDGDTRGSVNQ